MNPAKPAPRNDNALAVRVYIIATLVLTGIALAFYFSGFPARHPHVIKLVFFDPGSGGWDLTTFTRFKGWPLHGKLSPKIPGDFEQFNYGPFAAFLILFFLSLGRHPDWIYAFVIAATFGIAASFLLIAIRSHYQSAIAVLLAVCTSYPFAYVCDRGNIEGAIWLPCAAGFYCFVRKRYLGAAILFALAASVKPFPGMLLLLLLPKRRFKEFFIGLAVTLAITITSLAIIGPTIQAAFAENLRGFDINLQRYILVYRRTEIGVDHSLFSFLKQLMRILSGWAQPETLSSAIHTAYGYYVYFGATVFAISVLLLRRLPTLNQIFGISVLMVLLSPINNDYTLISIYFPWAILLYILSRPHETIPQRAACWIMICCSILFTPQYYLLFGTWAEFGAQVKTLALIGLLVIALLRPLPTRLLDEAASGPLAKRCILAARGDPVQQTFQST